MTNWNNLASDEIIQRTISALEDNGITAEVVNTGDEAKIRALSLIPQNSEVMNMTSVTLDTISIVDELNESHKYNSVKNKLSLMDRASQNLEMQKLGAAPEYTIGSVHAVTEDGRVVIASNTGSQLPAYAYGSSHVIWIVSTKKIVKNLDGAITRIYEHNLPLESERARQAYGVAGSAVNKILIINSEPVKDRINLIFVKEDLGF